MCCSSHFSLSTSVGAAFIDRGTKASGWCAEAVRLLQNWSNGTWPACLAAHAGAVIALGGRCKSHGANSEVNLKTSGGEYVITSDR